MHMGTLLLWVCMITTVVAFACYVAAGLGRRAYLPLGRSAYYGMTIAVAATSLYLLSALLNHRMDISYVWDYTSNDLPFVFLLSAFWAGQQGSFLLWALFAAVMGLFLAAKSDEYEPWLMAFWCIVQSFFFTVLVVYSPFAPTPQQMLAQIPQGQGLNPLLQNFWMAIHPPLVFLGYAAMTGPAALVVPALIRRDYRGWANRCLPWAIFGWVTLGAGIIVGSFWAYEVLGWGGYWGWDPVENASLIPWIAGTALVHGLLVERYRGSMRRTNLFLASTAFMMVIYAAFLTRSGLLANVSVHSFTDVGLNPYMLTYMLVFATIQFGLLIWRAWEARSAPWYGEMKSKEFAFFVALISLCMFAVFVLIGTSLPVFFNGTSVSNAYYGASSAPIAMVLLIVLALVPFLSWTSRTPSETTTGGRDLRPVWAVVAISLLSALVVLFLYGMTKAAQVAVGALAFTVLIISLWQVKHHASRNWKTIGGHVVHLGIAMMLIGMVFSPSDHKSRALTLPQDGKAVQAYGYSFSFKGMTPRSDGGTTFEIMVERKGKTFMARPAFREGMGGQMMGLPHIRNTFTHDLYIAPSAFRALDIEPTVRATDRGVERRNAQTPDGAVEVALMAVGENSSALLMVRESGKEEVSLEIPKGESREFGKYTFTFRGFNMQGAHGDSGESRMGAILEVTYPGAQPSAVVEVSLKPLIGLLWLGSILALLGGSIAISRRAGENRKILAVKEEEPEDNQHALLFD